MLRRAPDNASDGAAVSYRAPAHAPGGTVVLCRAPDNAPDNDQSGLPNNPVMVAPQQQELELAKANLGKQSPVIDKLTQPDNIGAEDGGDTLKRIVHLSKSQ